MFSPLNLLLLPSFIFFFVNAEQSVSPVQLSYDGGRTWLPSDSASFSSSKKPNKPLTASVLFRVKDSPSFVSLPLCAAERGPGSFEWRGLAVLGVHEPAMCSAERGFKHLYADPVHLVPEWHKYLHSPRTPTTTASSKKKNSDSDDNDEQGGDSEKRQSFWRKYGIYIAAFVIVSLVQGIREGNAQYEKEQEHIKREAARRLEQRTRANVVIPPRRKTKGKKAATKK